MCCFSLGGQFSGGGCFGRCGSARKLPRWWRRPPAPRSREGFSSAAARRYLTPTMIPAIVFTLCGAVPGPVAAPPQPKLLVVITVDQLRPDYLDRYRTQLNGGLAMLVKQGADFTEAYQDHAVTETAPGHSTILSGRWPAHTGIIRNTAGVQDSAAPLIGIAGPGAAPARFRGTELFDWLQAAEPKARALSVSRKDRGAILPIGRARQQVYWYQSGFFTTSRYYADSLPLWVREFNGRRIPFRAAASGWTRLLPERAYPEPDSEPYENGGRDVTFPHLLPADSTAAAGRRGGEVAPRPPASAVAPAGAPSVRLATGGTPAHHAPRRLLLAPDW